MTSRTLLREAAQRLDDDAADCLGHAQPGCPDCEAGHFADALRDLANRLDAEMARAADDSHDSMAYAVAMGHVSAVLARLDAPKSP